MTTAPILITGMSGLIGSALRRQLEGKHTLRALNRRPVEGIETHSADISELEAIKPAFTGVETVVHLAAIVGDPSNWEAQLKYNIIGTYNVFEAARQAGVKRVVFASSGATVGALEQEMPYKALAQGKYDQVAGGWQNLTHLSPTRPRGLYGASKVMGEVLARQFADSHSMSMLCVRIGRVNAEDKPLEVRDYSAWLSQGDCVRLLEACINAPAELKYDIFFGLSDNKYGYRDLKHPRQMLGWSPQDKAEDYR